MLHDQLLINDAKSEFLIIQSKQQLKKINISDIMIGEATVFPTTCVRNLGSWFDSELTMNTDIALQPFFIFTTSNALVNSLFTTLF